MGDAWDGSFSTEKVMLATVGSTSGLDEMEYSYGGSSRAGASALATRIRGREGGRKGERK